MTNSVMAFNAKLKLMARQIESVNKALAPMAVTMVQQNMSDPSFVDNAPLTKATKNNGAKPLFNTGVTRASMNYQLQADGGFIVGTNQPHAPLINYGGVVRPKKAKSLMLPSSRDVKKRTDAWGVKKVIGWLEAAGWRLFWRPGALIAEAPAGARPFGVKIVTRKKKRGIRPRNFFLIYYRKRELKVPAREFMKLSPEQVGQLMKAARQHVTKGKAQ